ncbi:MAG: molybdopterin-dependent oxidoreductase [Acidimicrobiia bacterium]|nr:molybdopterin-dependent oxidoreductase [Acidimicrobiia bacterium]
MARVPLEITRRSFLTSTAAALAGAGAVGLLPAEARAATGGTPWYREGEIVTTYNVCDICPWRCGIVVQTVNGEVRKVDGNPNDPKARGRLCARGQGGVSFMNDPDRLRSPMMRSGSRGEGKFQEVTWEQALDYIAEQLIAIRDRSGPEALAILGHTTGDFWLTDYFAQAWGTPNAAKPSSSLCLSPRDEAAKLTYGSAVGGHEPVDWEGLECVTLIGSHIGEDARNTLMQDFADMWGRGGKAIVVDPRFSSVATKADHWLPIKPGTDTALLLAWMHVLITEGLYDAEYVAEWTIGFNELATHVATLTPEWASEITDLPADQIRETARVMAAHAPRSAIMPGRHSTWYGNDTQRMRAVYLVNALLGAYGREGGIYFNRSPFLEGYPHPPFAIAGSSGGCGGGAEAASDVPAVGPSGKARADGQGETFLQGPTAMQELIDPMITGDPYRIEGLIAYGCNLLHSIPNKPRTIEALKALDLVVAVDVLPMEHVAYADVVLPEAVYLERYDTNWAVPYKTPFVHMREPAVPPMGDTMPGWWITRELGLRVGLDTYFRWESIEEWLNRELISIGTNLTDLHAAGGVVTQDGKPYFADQGEESPFHTPSGKIELYSAKLAEEGFDPIPTYEPVDEPPDGFYRLLYGRNPVHTFAKTQNTPVLNELYPENELWLNEDAAAAEGIEDGDEVWLENQDGARSGPIRVKATQRIRSDAVFMPHGFGHNAPGLSKANGVGASDTALQTRYALDPISGGAGMRVNFVTILKEA